LWPVPFLAVLWFFVARMYYMIYWKFDNYMAGHHKKEWMEMVKNFPPPLGYYIINRPITYFIFRSNENFGDNQIDIWRRKIRNMRYSFIMSMACALILVVLILSLTDHVCGHAS
jgi:hypothetical protein